MNRIERISAILIQLQSKKIVKAQEIAKRFEISLRTVYRDIRSLEESGVPLIGEAGVGYSLVDGYKLPPIMFSKEEAMALITAEKLVEKFTDSTTRNSYNSALYKIKAVLKTSEKVEVDNLSSHIEIIKNPYLPAKESNIAIESILKSIVEKRQISIQYFTNHSQEKNSRVVEPVGIFHTDRNWYMAAYCHLRNDYRNFKIDRISSLEILEIALEIKHPSLKSFLERTTIERELHKIVIRIEKHVLRYLGDEKYYQGFVSQKEITKELYELTFLTASINGFSMWFLMFANSAEIIEPYSLKTTIAEHIESLSKKYLISPIPTDTLLTI